MRVQGAFELVTNDRLDSFIRVREGSRQHYSQRPRGQCLKERCVATKERSEVVSDGRKDDVQKYGATVRGDADRELVWKGMISSRSRGGVQTRQHFRRDGAASVRKVGSLFRSTREPVQPRVGEHTVEHHQPLGDTIRWDWSPIRAVWFIDGSVQREMLHVIQLRAIMSAGVGDGVAVTHQLVEKGARFLPLHNARERCVLPQQTDAGVSHYEREKARLPRRKSERRHSLRAIVGSHKSSSGRSFQEFFGKAFTSAAAAAASTAAGTSKSRARTAI